MAFEYDFAVSYASDTRDVALQLTDALTSAGYRVFYDRREEHALTGRDGAEALAEIYTSRAKLCILLLSAGYDASPWTTVERDAIQHRERVDFTNFLIPVLVQGDPPPWLGERRLRFDLENRGIDELIALLKRRAAEHTAVRARPEILWRAKVGIGTWKHEPIPRGDFLYVASAGETWNQRDALDGIHCLRRSDGGLEWHFRTYGDANAMLFDNDRIFVGTDAGAVYSLDAATGAQRWAHRRRSPVLAKPLLVGKSLITFDADGELAVYNAETGGSFLDGKNCFVWNVRGGVVADPVVYGDVVFVVSRAGVVFELPVDTPIPNTGQNPQNFPQRSLTLTTWSQFQLDGRVPCRFHATPVVLDELIFVPHVRDTLYPGVPVAAIERRRMLERFTVAEAQEPEKRFGNVRARPVVADGLVIVPVAYGNQVVAFDRSGRIVWTEHCGVPYFPQWGSPAAYRHDVLVPRFDGFLHALRAKDGQKRWSMFLGGGDLTGEIYVHDEIPGANRGISWKNTSGDSLNAPVTVAGDTAYVHTSGGTLYAIGLPTEG